MKKIKFDFHKIFLIILFCSLTLMGVMYWFIKKTGYTKYPIMIILIDLCVISVMAIIFVFSMVKEFTNNLFIFWVSIITVVVISLLDYFEIIYDYCSVLAITLIFAFIFSIIIIRYKERKSVVSYILMFAFYAGLGFLSSFLFPTVGEKLYAFRMIICYLLILLSCMLPSFFDEEQKKEINSKIEKELNDIIEKYEKRIQELEKNYSELLNKIEKKEQKSK